MERDTVSINGNTQYRKDVNSFSFQILSQSKSQQDFFLYVGKVFLKFKWKSKRSRIAKTILKKNKIGVFIPPNFKV